ncbi:MAG: hypothetical protein KAH77_06335 [Thiomargarita sp.]|nr:hypothetical protein [Thiomargarita sp.]
MDEREYQQTSEKLTQNPCPFENVIFTGRCACQKSERFNIAEREIATCQSSASQARCVNFLNQIYNHVLEEPQLKKHIPHSQMMKVQCGSLFGIAALVDECANTPHIDNIDVLLIEALEKFEDFPYDKLLKFVNNFQVRGKRKKT